MRIQLPAAVMLHALFLAAPVASAQTGSVRTIVDSLPAGTGGLEVGTDGMIYSADFGPSLDGPAGTRVWRISPDGSFRVFAEGFTVASGNTFTPDGQLLQSNFGADAIMSIDANGAVRTVVSTGIDGPVGIIRGPDGAYYVADCEAHEVQRVTLDGGSTTFAADSLLRCPNGIALGSDGNLYVANFANGDVLRVNPRGEVSRLVTLPGGNNGHLIFGNGVLYVIARRAGQIWEVSLEGDMRLVAGVGQRGYRDGPAGQAMLSLPNDLALSPDGRTLYFNEVAPTTTGPRILAPTRIRAVTLAEH